MTIRYFCTINLGHRHNLLVIINHQRHFEQQATWNNAKNS